MTSERTLNVFQALIVAMSAVVICAIYMDAPGWISLVGSTGMFAFSLPLIYNAMRKIYQGGEPNR